MKKILTFAVASLATLIMGAGMASAASITNAQFSNGDVTIDAQGGSTVNGTFTLTVGSNEVCEVLRTWDDSQPFTDTVVGDSQLGYQEGVYTNVPFSVKVPINTGTASAYAQCAGIYGGIHSVSGADNVVAGPTNLGTIRVIANSTNSTGSTSSTSMDQLTALIASLTAQVQALLHPTTPPAPVVSPACTNLAQALVGTSQGVNNDANASLQGFLLSPLGGRQSIPLLKAGAAFGFYGTQTANAVSTFKLQNSCQ